MPSNLQMLYVNYMHAPNAYLIFPIHKKFIMKNNKNKVKQINFLDKLPTCYFTVLKHFGVLFKHYKQEVDAFLCTLKESLVYDLVNIL